MRRVMRGEDGSAVRIDAAGSFRRTQQCTVSDRRAAQASRCERGAQTEGGRTRRVRSLARRGRRRPGRRRVCGVRAFQSRCRRWCGLARLHRSRKRREHTGGGRYRGTPSDGDEGKCRDRDLGAESSCKQRHGKNLSRSGTGERFDPSVAMRSYRSSNGPAEKLRTTKKNLARKQPPGRCLPDVVLVGQQAGGRETARYRIQ